jgi:hypothetical protein
MTLIAVTGYKNSGKNAVCNVLAAEYDFKITGMADALKEQMLILNPWVDVSRNDGWCKRLSKIVGTIGWDEAKEQYPEIRRLLQIGGTEAGRNIFGQNIWAETWYKRTKVWLEQGYDVCVSDLRFLNEAAFVHDLFGEVWRVYRPGTDVGDQHASETELDKIAVDQVIQNDASLEDLLPRVRHLMDGRR